MLWFSQIIFLNNFYKFVKINEIKRSVDRIERHLGKNNDIEGFIEEILKQADMEIEIISMDNESVFFPGSNALVPLHRDSSYKEYVINEVRSANVFQIEYSNEDFLARMMVSPDEPEILPRNRVTSAAPFVTASDSTMLMSSGTTSAIAVRIAKPEEENLVKRLSTLQSEPRMQAARAIPSIISISGIEHAKWLLYGKVINDALGNENIILVRSVITPIDATVDTLKIQLIYITIAMIFISIVLSLAIARQVSKPIEKINFSAKNLAKANYNVDFSCSGYKEIVELSETLNYATVELSKVENLRRELIANISHDLRTPLTLISGFAEMMRDLPKENTKENAAVIVEETNRLTHIVNDLLEFSKLQAAVQKVELKKYNLIESLTTVINPLNELVKKDGYKVRFICEKDFFVYSDEQKINQAFYNLLTNAVNYTGEDKLVDVIVEETGNEVIVNVVDYGEGIEAENLPHIWERYYRIDKVHKRASAGSGIGLSIVKSIFEMCPDVKYGASSQVGIGTTFYFSLQKF